jgi:outer membrane murein-binding lipoprotein Lpp
VAKTAPVQPSSGTSGTSATAPPDTQLAQLAAITARLESGVDALARNGQAAHNGNLADGDAQQRDLQRP